jgi:hypothetical protein
MSYAILRTKKIKSWAALGAVARHNDRRSSPVNADPAGQVVQLVGNGDIEAEARARLISAGIDPSRLRKDAVVAVEALLTASPRYFRPGCPAAAGVWDQDRLDAWLDRVKQFLGAEWGNRVVSVTLHLDEATPHLHVVWLPIDDTPRKRGPATRLNAGRWLDGAAKLRALQDRYGVAMAQLGLERGVRRSRARHDDVRRMYGAMQRDAETATTLTRRTAVKLGEAEFARRQAAEQERKARRLLDAVEAIYRQIQALLPDLVRSALATPIRQLRQQLAPVAERAERDDLVRE